MPDEVTNRRRVIVGIAAGLVPLAPRATRAQPPYTEISYQSGRLRIQGYFYQPAGSGPFPTLIYNHGSRVRSERQSIPWVRLAGLYVSAGYAVLVPERRGYGRSDGPTWSEAVGGDVGSALIARLQAEADDVLAAAEFLRNVPAANTGRLGVAGWSLGGIVTILAISRSRSFRAAIDQAGGVLMWRTSPVLQEAYGTLSPQAYEFNSSSGVINGSCLRSMAACGGSTYLRHVHEQEGQRDGSRQGKPAQNPQAFMGNVSLVNHQPLR
jgi:dipeptidyl aminopeptidase/acylaminoacyl peptidase